MKKDVLKHLFLFFLFFLLPTIKGTAQFAFLKEGKLNYLEMLDELEPIQASLIAEEKTIQPGRPFWLAIKLEIAKDWHSYWKNPGNSGPTNKVEWSLPENFQIDPLLWPSPLRIETNDLINFGYKDSVLLLARVSPPITLPLDNNVTISATLHWFACKDRCIPGETPLSITLPIKGAPPDFNETTRDEFISTRKSLPQNLWHTSANYQSDHALLYFYPLSREHIMLRDAYFYPEQAGIIDPLAEQKFVKDANGYFLKIKLQKNIEPSLITSLKGVLFSSSGWNNHGTSGGININVPFKVIPSSPKFHHTKVFSTPPVSPNSSSPKLIKLLGFALLGGLILNLMPCVFPMISLNIYYLSRLSKKRRPHLFFHGLLFSMGIVLSFCLLGSLLLVLRSNGESLGWGFQLQNPIFVSVLIWIFFLYSMNLFNLPSIKILPFSSLFQRRSSTLLFKTLLSGIFTFILATPCIGPFLGTTLAITLTLPPLQSILVLSFIALGLSIPYLLFSIFPIILQSLPKPGKWLITFKQAMGFLMVTSTIWLLWVLGAQTESNAVITLLLSLLFLNVALYIRNKQKKQTNKFAKYFSLVTTFSFFLSASLLAIQTSFPKKNILPFSYKKNLQKIVWEPFSLERIHILQKYKTPVFVNFTAKWCLISQGNKISLYSDKVLNKFSQKGVVLMEADWTSKDPTITHELEKFGLIGVPLCLLYQGDPSLPALVLPQILSSKTIIEYLDKTL